MSSLASPSFDRGDTFTFTYHLKAHGTGHGGGFNQFYPYIVPQTKPLTGTFTDHGLLFFNMVEIISSEGGGRDKPVRAGFVELYEQAGFCYPGNFAGEIGPYRI